MSETTYFCWKCKSKTHWANDICPKGVLVEDKNVPASKEVQDSQKQGKFDRVAYQREYMRRYRAR